jgi:ribosome modulation factor
VSQGRNMQNPYNEGLAHARRKGSTAADCPYSSVLMAHERQQWLSGFLSRQAHVHAPTAKEQGSRELPLLADVYA